MQILYVALGGALGAVLRYLISLIPYCGNFPILTLLTNLLGAIAIGFIVGLTETGDFLKPGGVLFLKTGLCGGFTTFSTFSLETYNLITRKKYIAGTAYAILSLCLCILGVYIGKAIALKLFSK